MASETYLALLRAGQLLASHGWTRRRSAGTLDRPYTPADIHRLRAAETVVPLCVAAAVDYASPTPEVAHEAHGYLRAAVGRFAVTAWNDAPGRTVAQCVDALDRAAALCGAEP